MTSNHSNELILDHILNQFYTEHDDVITYTQFCHGLNQLRQRSTNKEWVRFINEGYRNHPRRNLIVQDPFTQHVLFKPKDTGTSVLMDFIYALKV